MGIFLLPYPENQDLPSPGTRYDMYRSPKLVCTAPLDEGSNCMCSYRLCVDWMYGDGEWRGVR